MQLLVCVKKCLFYGSLLLPLVSSAHSRMDTGVLLLQDSTSSASVMDCAGAGAALTETGIVHSYQDVSRRPLTAESLAGHGVAIACNLELAPAWGNVLESWVVAGGGLLATGMSGFGVEALLGLSEVLPAGGANATDVRFIADHPATTGAWWLGPILASPPVPVEHMPPIMRHPYLDQWPAWATAPGDGNVLARWRNLDDEWSAPDNKAAVIAHTPGAGRTVYSGALPGVYANWDWPHSWRAFLISAVEWLATDSGLVEIGYWPHAHRAAFSWTGDTEKPEMITAVPALLELFSDLGLERFGTFYVVGQAGGAEGTVGALEHPDVVRAIAAAGSEVGGHGDIHGSFKAGGRDGGGHGYSHAHADVRPVSRLLIDNPRLGGHRQACGNCQGYDEQYVRLEAMRDLIDPIIEPYSERVTGFRAPYISQNKNTFAALADLGFGYDAGEADVWSQTTLPHRIGDMWELPPTMPMDYHLFETAQLDPGVVEMLFLDKLSYVIARRGLFSWLHHPWVIEDHIDMVRNVLTSAINRGDVWMARQDDILDWWVAREDVRIDQIDQQGQRLHIHVQNQGSEAIAGVSIWIRAPADADAWDARADGQPLALVERAHAQGVFRVAVLPTLTAGQTVILKVVMGDAVFSDRFER